MEILFCRRQIFFILIIHKPFQVSCEVNTKFGPDRFSRFEVYWIQIGKQKSRVSIYYLDYRNALLYEI